MRMHATFSHSVGANALRQLTKVLCSLAGNATVLFAIASSVLLVVLQIVPVDATDMSCLPAHIHSFGSPRRANYFTGV